MRGCRKIDVPGLLAGADPVREVRYRAKFITTTMLEDFAVAHRVLTESKSCIPARIGDWAAPEQQREG